MGKHHFTIKNQGKTFRCYLDEDGRVYVTDENKKPVGTSSSTGISKIEDAKEAARLMIESTSKSDE